MKDEPDLPLQRVERREHFVFVAVAIALPEDDHEGAAYDVGCDLVGGVPLDRPSDVGVDRCPITSLNK